MFHFTSEQQKSEQNTKNGQHAVLAYTYMLLGLYGITEYKQKMRLSDWGAGGLE